jgi:hypothetical protein
LFKNIVSPFPVGTEICLKEIRKKEKFKYEKHDKELDEDDDPDPVSPP